MDATVTKEKTGQEMISAARITEPVVVSEAVDFSVMASFKDADDDSDIVVELIDLFLDDVPQKLERMREAEVLKNVVSVRGVAHGLKGSSASLGADYMATLCNEVESSAGNLSDHDMNTLLTRLDFEFERVRLALSAERYKRRHHP
jgi:HPt (histidine-containing phosphotransfer) domain-containing protein